MVTNEKQHNDQKLLPWMPYVFGFIFLLAAVGLFFLFSEKKVHAEEVQTAANPEQIIEPVKTLLEDIKSGKTKEGYNNASSDFKIAMPYDSFYNFIHQYDTLKKYSSLSFSDPQIEQNVASVVAYLHFDKEEETLPISFTLINDGGTWKVYGFILNSANTDIPIKDIETLKDLIHTVNQELAYLKKDNLMSAYYKMTTKNFQTTTPYDAFENFVKSNRIFLEQEGATFSEGKVEGKNGRLTVTLFNEEDSIPIDYFLAQEEGKWKIDRIEILLPTNLQKPLEQKEIDDLMEVVNIFLQTIHEGLTEKAYNIFTSDAFKKSTSLPVFEAFVDDHPILKEEQNPKYIEGGKEDNVRIVYLIYGKQPYQTAFELKMIKDAGGWKILGITIEKSQEDTYAQPLDKEQSLDLIHSLLITLNHNQYEKFYRVYASKGFARTTPYNEFLSFLEGHSVLKNNPKPFIEEMVQDRDHLYLETELVDQSHSYSALFVFVYENGAWKVHRMEVKSDKKVSPVPNNTEITLNQIIIGQKIDDVGMIQDSEIPMDKPKEPIYMNVFLTSPVADTTIEVLLAHSESKTKTLPVVGRVESEGNNILTFTFAPPENGWPRGHYSAEAKSGKNLIDFPFALNYEEQQHDHNNELSQHAN